MRVSRVAGWFGSALLGSGLVLLTQFVDGRSQLAALWLAAGGLFCLWGRAPLARVWALGWAVLLLLAPGTRVGSVGCVASSWLGFSPFNLISERDLSTLGIGFFYGGSPRVRAAVDPIYAEMEGRPEYRQMTHAVACSAQDLFGLGPGSQQLFYFSRSWRGGKLLLFLHGAMGNLQAYTSYWQTFAEKNDYTVVCPGFGFGFWYRAGGVERAAWAWRYAHETLQVEAGGALVVCLSNGATGGVRLVREHPEMVDQLVLVSPVLEPELVGSPEFAAGLKHPPLILEGDEDVNVRPESVEKGVAAMGRVGIRPKVRLLHGHDHFLLFSARREVSESILQLR